MTDLSEESRKERNFIKNRCICLIYGQIQFLIFFFLFFYHGNTIIEKQGFRCETDVDGLLRESIPPVNINLNGDNALFDF